MNEPRDSLELAMQALKARSRERAMSDVNLENRIMNEFGVVQARRRRRITTALVASLAMVVSGVGFTAAGGVEVVRGWFVRVEVADPSGNPSKLRVFDKSGQEVGEINVIGGGPQGPEDGSNNPELNVQLDQH